MRTWFYSAFLSAILFSSHSVYATSICGIEVRAESLGSFHLKVSIPQNFNQLVSPKNDSLSTELKSYRESISAKINTDPIFLLKRQRVFFEKSSTLKRFVKRYDSIINEKIGSIRTMNCLETALMTLHLKNMQGSLEPSEFAGWVLEDRSASKTILYFTSSKTSSVGTPTEIGKSLDRDLKNGSTFIQHIHNHPFSLSALPNRDVAGTLIPSGESVSSGDVSYYLSESKKSGLKSAVITNGFDSIEFRAEHFEDL